MPRTLESLRGWLRGWLPGSSERVQRAMRIGIAYLLHPKTLLGLGLGFSSAFIWISGWLLYDLYPSVALLSPAARLLYITLLVVACVGLGYLRGHLASQKSLEIEARLQAQAQLQLEQTRPDRQSEIAELEGRFESAVERLKHSKLGRGALYALPWYVIIGPPGSGKTKMLTESSLNFVSSSEDGRGVRGVGGTRNCDWWFADEGILLDTAGRYTTGSDDHEEWLAFLEMLKKARREAPINGVVVCMSLAEREHDGRLSGLLHMDEDELIDHVQKIRARLSELMNRLELVFPVYVVFTKCDMLNGFVETFGGMTRDERAQIWGVTDESREGAVAPLIDRFEKEHDELYARLTARRLRLLAEDRSRQRAQRVYSFPLEFAVARDRVRRFLELLTRSHSLEESPRFRGFFFTSGTQEGDPFDNILQQACGAYAFEGSEDAGETHRKKSYFIDDLLQKLIFRDRELATSTMRIEKRRRRVRFAGVLGAAAAGLIASALLIGRYSLASEQVARVRDAVDVYREGGAARSVPVRLAKLRALVRQEDALDVSFPIGTGAALRSTVREAYGQLLFDSYLEGLRVRVRERLESEAFASELTAIQERITAGRREQQDLDKLRSHAQWAQALLIMHRECLDETEKERLLSLGDIFVQGRRPGIRERDAIEDFAIWLSHYIADEGDGGTYVHALRGAGAPELIASQYRSFARQRSQDLERVLGRFHEPVSKEDASRAGEAIAHGVEGAPLDAGTARADAATEPVGAAHRDSNADAAAHDVARTRAELQRLGRRFDALGTSTTFSRAWEILLPELEAYWSQAGPLLMDLLLGEDFEPATAEDFVTALRRLHEEAVSELMTHTAELLVAMDRAELQSGFFDTEASEFAARRSQAQSYLSRLEEITRGLERQGRAQIAKLGPARAALLREVFAHVTFVATRVSAGLRDALLTEVGRAIEACYTAELGEELARLNGGFPFDPDAERDACGPAKFEELFRPEAGRFDQVRQRILALQQFQAPPGREYPLLRLPAGIAEDFDLVRELQELFFRDGQQAELELHCGVQLLQDVEGHRLELSFDSETWSEAGSNLPQQTQRRRSWRPGTRVGLRLVSETDERAAPRTLYPQAAEMGSAWSLLRLFYSMERLGRRQLIGDEDRVARLLWNGIRADQLLGPYQRFVLPVESERFAGLRLRFHVRAPRVPRARGAEGVAFDALDSRWLRHRFYTGSRR
jgi:DNA polymerase III delta prime subunit